jgi:hypothetical protein
VRKCSAYISNKMKDSGVNSFLSFGKQRCQTCETDLYLTHYDNINMDALENIHIICR